MTEKISKNRQLYTAVDSHDMVNNVKQVLKDCFHSAAAMQVIELEVSQKYMATETYGSTLNINLSQQWTPPTTQTELQQRHMPITPAPARVKKMFLLSKRSHVLVEGGRNTNILAGTPWLTSGNGKICHSQTFSRNMCRTITGTKACNRYTDI